MHDLMQCSFGALSSEWMYKQREWKEEQQVVASDGDTYSCSLTFPFCRYTISRVPLKEKNEFQIKCYELDSFHVNNS